ncbi:hypothetical protein [Streptomyces sp. SID8352]|uniref:hypothetical protein n=1 Tax=Streptomyces sp. SID8352 TaxID=2690338 RepID=UPI001370EC9A|nr:hypothetical protein [Streptomyces sp. SID8352]MYU24564.1 hypothetical protein [Streptomyces sp. SID8352]
MIAETVCSAVSAAGLGIAAVTAYRRCFLAAVRVAAYALVPLGLVLTGAVKWLSGLAVSPTAWVGFALLGVSWLLFMIVRTVERRRAGTPREERGAAGAAPRGEAVAPAASKPAVGGASRAVARPGSGSSRGEDDFSDIEAILKKHGI